MQNESEHALPKDLIELARKADWPVDPPHYHTLLLYMSDVMALAAGAPREPGKQRPKSPHVLSQRDWVELKDTARLIIALREHGSKSLRKKELAELSRQLDLYCDAVQHLPAPHDVIEADEDWLDRTETERRAISALYLRVRVRFRAASREYFGSDRLNPSSLWSTRRHSRARADLIAAIRELQRLACAALKFADLQPKARQILTTMARCVPPLQTKLQKEWLVEALGQDDPSGYRAFAELGPFVESLGRQRGVRLSCLPFDFPDPSRS